MTPPSPRLTRDAPAPGDLEDLHRIYSDARTWTHLPSGRFADLATQVAHAAVDAARERRPELPVVAYLLEHNAASAAVTRKVGLSLRHRAPDAGNPDPTAIRLVMADRELTEQELAATLR